MKALYWRSLERTQMLMLCHECARLPQWVICDPLYKAYMAVNQTLEAYS